MSSTKLRALIVDDESLGRERVRIFLEKDDQVEIVGECPGGIAALEAIQNNEIDVVFLDIQMPDLDGFGVIRELEKLKKPLPSIVFVTAYDKHAVRAFEVHAVDYLLKPIDRERLRSALDRVREIRERAGMEDTIRLQLQALLAGTGGVEEKEENVHPQRIEVRSHGRWDYVPVSDIHWINADGNYLEIHTASDEFLHRETMSKMESQLDPDQFLRIGRSTIVCLNRVKSVTTLGRSDHLAIMEDGSELPITRNLKELQNRLRYGGG